ncbi:hypothetical protein chiPu_0020344, partial [Chiloscyllium punctatum]|nr:hypothetical protein [Chiloscyllium punctatum]
MAITFRRWTNLNLFGKFEQNRAQAAMELLRELNSDVSGNFMEESLEQLLENDPTFFLRFNIVIATQLSESSLLRLSAILWKADVPLLVCRTYGLVGYMRLAVKEHPVVESHPDNALEDLRLDSPFPHLKDHIQAYDLDKMDKKHSSQLPKTYKEKEAFRELIRQGLLKKDNGTPEDEENFDEAIKNVNTALNPTKIPSNVEELFKDERCTNINAQSPSFWILTRAVKQFVEKEGLGNLPVRGTIPDMIADSTKFIRLQNIYREKAKEDASVIGDYVTEILESIGRPPDTISEKDIWLFCRNAAFLRLVRCRSLAEEFNAETTNKEEIASCMENLDSEMVLYIMLRAVDCFHRQHGRYPVVGMVLPNHMLLPHFWEELLPRRPSKSSQG